MFMMETEGHFVPQSFSVAGKINITFTGTDDDEEGYILAIELIQNIKPDEGDEPSHVKLCKAVTRLKVELDCTLKWKQV